MHGWLSIEYKKGKWQKRYCFVKDNAIHHAKDNHKGSTTSILCHLSTYDVYTLLPPLKASPTPYVFAIRAQDRSSIFEREGDYMRCLAVEDADEMKDWVLSIRCTKVSKEIFIAFCLFLILILRVKFSIKIIQIELLIHWLIFR